MMPNKTIYVRDSDMLLFEQAQEQLGDSISALFAEFLRERVGKLTPDERRILDLIRQVEKKREAVQKEAGMPAFIDGEYAEAESYAQMALRSFQKGEIRNTKILFYAANAYHDRAERDLKDTRELNQKMSRMLEKR